MPEALNPNEIIKMLDGEMQSKQQLKPFTSAENMYRVRKVRDKSITLFREHQQMSN